MSTLGTDALRPAFTCWSQSQLTLRTMAAAIWMRWIWSRWTPLMVVQQRQLNVCAVWGQVLPVVLLQLLQLQETLLLHLLKLLLLLRQHQLPPLPRLRVAVVVMVVVV